MDYQEILENPSIQYAIISGKIDAHSDEEIMRFYQRIFKTDTLAEKRRELAQAQMKLSEMLPGTARIEQASRVWSLKREVKALNQEKNCEKDSTL